MPELAEARGVRAQRMELLFLIVMALATSHDRARGRRAADLQPDDRPARRRPVAHRQAAARDGPRWSSPWSWCGCGSPRPTTTGRSASSSALSGRCVAAGRGWAAFRRAQRTAASNRGSGPRGAQEHGLQAANVRV